MGWYF